MLNPVSKESVDLTQQNIEKLKELFPEILTDGNKVDFDMLQTILGEEIDGEKERYSFTWPGKRDAIIGAQQPSRGTLRPNIEKSKDFDTTENLYIEGDNLEVLKLLQKSYNNKIKVIYIDPPYNTGKDFVYKDDFRDGVENYLEQTGQVDAEGNLISTNSESNGRFHTDWLNMVFPRLKLARNLLSEDGVIYISIDDNEQANLKKMCDEVFGEQNFIGTFVVKSTPNGRDYGHIAKQHEYVLFYAKNVQFTKTNLLEDSSKKFKYHDNLGGYNIHPLYNSNEAFHKGNRPNLYYPFYLNPNKKIDDVFFEISLVYEEGFVEVFPPKSLRNNVQFVWRWGKKLSKDNLNTEIVGYSTNGEYRIVQKMRNTSKLIRSLLMETDFSSRRGTSEVEEIFRKKVFDFPKPLNLIYSLLESSTDRDSIVLDLFSGSSTTAHAVMQLNAKDEGKRKFIMIQLPEKLEHSSNASKEGYETLSDIGSERIRRAGEQIIQDNPLLDGEIDIGFKYLNLDKSNIKEWNTDFDNLEEELDLFSEVFVGGRNELDVVYEIMLKNGLELTLPMDTFEVSGKTVYDIAFGLQFICLADEIDTSIAKAIINKRDEYGMDIISGVVFKDAGFNGNDSAKLNCIQLLKDAGFIEENLQTI